MARHQRAMLLSASSAKVIPMRSLQTAVFLLPLLLVQPVFSQPKLFLEQGVLSIETSEGKVFSKKEVKGAEFVLPPAVKIRIDDVTEKASAAGQALLFYQLSFFDTAAQSWQPYCDKDPQGNQLALFYYGHVDQEKGYQPVNKISITCSSGVIAKCMTWGYSPYAEHTNAAALFNACLRMARADYCGNGKGYTRNGTLINIYDNLGIQKRGDIQEDQELAFEAAWNEKGAVCVHHSRIQENIDIEGLIRACPEKFSAANTGESCSQKRYPDALLYNDSRQSRKSSAGTANGEKTGLKNPL